MKETLPLLQALNGLIRLSKKKNCMDFYDLSFLLAHLLTHIRDSDMQHVLKSCIEQQNSVIAIRRNDLQDGKYGAEIQRIQRAEIARAEHIVKVLEQHLKPTEATKTTE